MGLNQLLHQGDVVQALDLQQHDGQVAGDGLTPEPRLIAAIGNQHRMVGAHRGVRIKQRRGHLLEQSGIGQRGVELTQKHLAMGPGQVEHAVGEVAVTVFVDEVKAVITAVGDTGDQVDGGLLAGLQGNPAANRDHRIEHRACTA